MPKVVPVEVQHKFAFAFDLTQEAANGGKCYRCSACRTWTQNPVAPELIYHVCPQHDRRKGTRRKRDRRETL